ncbi:MAG: Gldg family protein, partial [Firmicutes bacterium]|nr:Gldg family protein [Bacillota bacterium]
YQSSYEYTEDGGYAMSTSFNGEGALTSAIHYVISEEETLLYLLEGHGEQELSSGFREFIEDANISMDNLNLLTEGGVPADCDCLVVNGPSVDVSRAEAEILGEYLEDGGRMLLMTACLEEELPNLAGVMKEYGVSQTKGMIVEGNRNYCIQSYANYLLPEVLNHEITEPLVSSGYLVLVPLAQGLKIDEEAAGETGTEISVLLQTSSDAYSKVSWANAETAEASAGDIVTEEGFPLGVAISRQQTEDGETDGGARDGQETRIVWCTSTYLGNDQMNESVSGANYDLLMNSLNWICQMEDSITIHAKSLSETYLTLTAAQTLRWSVVLVVLVPLAFIVAGIVMWRKRRKL